MTTSTQNHSNNNNLRGRMKYTVRYRKEEEGGYSGQCIELPAAISQGETIEELKANIADAIQLVLEDMIEESKEKKDNIITLEVPVRETD